MMLHFLFLGLCAITANAAALVEDNCAIHDAGLQWLQRKLSSSALISCKGSPGQVFNAHRYWGLQFSKTASVVVFPANAQDVSYTVKVTSKTPLGKSYAFVSGGHSMTNASSSYTMVIDLAYLNKTMVISNYPNPSGNGKIPAVIAYEGGSNWVQVDAVTKGTGWTAVGARISNVGVGGFLQVVVLAFLLVHMVMRWIVLWHWKSYYSVEISSWPQSTTNTRIYSGKCHNSRAQSKLRSVFICGNVLYIGTNKTDIIPGPSKEVVDNLVSSQRPIKKVL